MVPRLTTTTALTTVRALQLPRRATRAGGRCVAADESRADALDACERPQRDMGPRTLCLLCVDALGPPLHEEVTRLQATRQAQGHQVAAKAE